MTRTDVGSSAFPLPPPDSTLDGMGAALDEQTLKRVLARNLTRTSDETVHIERCRPYYVKYRPGRNCVVQYELTITSEDAEPTTTIAHSILYRPGRAEKVLGRARSERTFRESAPGIEAVSFVPDLGGLFLPYPVDLKMAGLETAASAQEMTRFLRDRLSGPFGPEVSVTDAELVRYKAERRAVLRYRLQGTGPDLVFAKVRTTSEIEALLDVARTLRQAGVATPAPLGRVAELGVVITAAAPGTRLKDLRATSEYRSWMEPVAATLAHLHSARMASPPPPYSYEEEAAELIAAGGVLGALRPDLAARADALAGRIGAELGTDHGSGGPVHGSFHDDQVLVSDDGVAIVDFDSARWGDPLLDVGHFAAYLSAGGAEDARAHFLEAYGRLRTGPMRRALLFEAACLLRWATIPFRELEPEWPAALGQRAELAADRLEAYEKTP